MTVPRPDGNIAARVKALEEKVRRIELKPSLAQSAVAPLAVKGSGWFDSSAGNEPKVYDGTSWVPVRDETIAVAQTTADTAAANASTALAKFPITATDITDGAISTPQLAADAIDGMTITGALIRTAATGKRWEIDSPLHADEIRGYTGDPAEVNPALLQVSPIEMTLVSPDQGAGTASVELVGNTSQNQAYVVADDGVFLRGDGALNANQIWVSAADGANLSASSGAHQMYVDATGAVVTTTGGSGQVLIESGAGGTALTSTGAVTINGAAAAISGPYWYGFLASSPAALASGAVVDITTWSADGSPNSSGITHSSGIFTVPTAGRYRITAQLTYPASNTTGSRVMQVFTGTSGGTNLLSGASTGNAANITSAYGSKTVRLTAGATFRVTANQGSGLSLSLVAGANWSFVQVEWVGP